MPQYRTLPRREQYQSKGIKPFNEMDRSCVSSHELTLMMNNNNTLKQTQIATNQSFWDIWDLINKPEFK